jgi:hypothetical protein
VSVDEARQQEAAGEVDDCCPRAAQLVQVGADGGDPAGADRDLQTRPMSRPVEDRAVDEQRVHSANPLLVLLPWSTDSESDGPLNCRHRYSSGCLGAKSLA